MSVSFQIVHKLSFPSICGFSAQIILKWINGSFVMQQIYTCYIEVLYIDSIIMYCLI